MEITISEQRVFLIPEVLTPEQARERAWDKKVGVFASGLTSILSRPRGEDIKITYSEKRYEPFWLIHYQTSFQYDRKRNFPLQVTGPEVQSVTISNLNFSPVEDKKLGKVIMVPGVEQCREEHQGTCYFDGLSGEKRDFSYALKFRLEEIQDLENFSVDGVVVPPEIRASFVVRQVLQELMKPLQADKVFEEKIELTRIELYLRPVYAFEYHWVPKDRTGIAEFDGLTGEMRTGGKTFKQIMKTVLKRDFLFDLGADAIGTIIPGGGLVVRAAQVAVEYTKTKKEKQ
ncbi:MAG: hypothetical protein NUV68_03475 [Caldiserica bacterium]|nr:hypothetical protein [Caldisericota bacterium]MDH7562397.1 hypothetical protein [Caldisericota bacterium]